jgi:hypothetical protein
VDWTHLAHDKDELLAVVKKGNWTAINPKISVYLVYCMEHGKN